MKVKDFMITDVIFAKKEDSIKSVMKILVDKKIGGVPIVDDKGILVGIISDGDIIRNINPKEEKMYDFMSYIFYIKKEELEEGIELIKDANIMTIARRNNIYCVSPEDSMEKVLSMFSKHNFKKIPVINKERQVVGVVSRGDVIRYVQKKIIDKM
ncbi:CBS domain containing membrane protein [Clostridium sp. DL-VIII]|uniref:CBS domain-containing protein n=1 Tax=Clostridium sp. DL-VIII TaxID=641107 RepID=UPI00023AFBBC|nr:CBS domain-containing protein [Clostridium sp. DL-VIII]EHI99486.1 CBS domain containing membrane protein [Clostridium sp. DL-VIII]